MIELYFLAGLLVFYHLLVVIDNDTEAKILIDTYDYSVRVLSLFFLFVVSLFFWPIQLIYLIYKTYQIYKE